MAKPLVLSLALLAMPLTAAADIVLDHQGKVPLLVELYTSEGCSSCPPADRYLSSLVDQTKLWKTWIPLAFHVNYWDYIGWPDRFAQPQFSQRQRDYQRLGAVRSVYTPGWVVDGQEWKGFFYGKDIPDQQQRQGGRLTVERTEQQFNVRYQPLSGDHTRLTAHIAVMDMDQHSQVTAGENRGRKLSHQFVVSHKQQAQSDTLHWQFKLPAPSGNQQQALAVWLTDGRSVQPVQAAGGWLTPSN